jgi:hypothetical protein
MAQDEYVDALKGTLQDNEQARTLITQDIYQIGKVLDKKTCKPQAELPVTWHWNNHLCDIIQHPASGRHMTRSSNGHKHGDT